MATKRGVKKGAAARAMPGRALVVAILVGFLLVATGVIARRSYGIRQQRIGVELQHRREALEADRVRLDAEVREASSRARLAPVVQQRLDMHLPDQGQIIYVPRVTRAPHDSQ
ncbi:MAG: cell division protein FtsL family protein [Gemmatimonadetes bacterium]|nr:cell division protein FtsL family protein [Gemmatimonadota bacterium]